MQSQNKGFGAGGGQIKSPLSTTEKGEMPEWSIGPHSKCGVRATVPGVRIPLSPQISLNTKQLQKTRTVLRTQKLKTVRVFILNTQLKGLSIVAPSINYPSHSAMA